MYIYLSVWCVLKSIVSLTCASLFAAFKAFQIIPGSRQQGSNVYFVSELMHNECSIITCHTTVGAESSAVLLEPQWKLVSFHHSILISTRYDPSPTVTAYTTWLWRACGVFTEPLEKWMKCCSMSKLTESHWTEWILPPDSCFCHEVNAYTCNFSLKMYFGSRLVNIKGIMLFPNTINLELAPSYLFFLRNNSFSATVIQLMKLYLPAILNIHLWSWSASRVNTRCRRWGEHPVAFCQIIIIQLSNRTTKTNKTKPS